LLDVILRLAAFGWAALILGFLPGGAAAQHITVAGGVAGPHPLSGPNYLIVPNLGKEVGGNLFDSFLSFSLTAGQSATFTGPATIRNIIVGVTGGSQSTINGPIRSDIRGANLYLINPDGVVFRPHGSVNVSGSFYASTADYLKLGRNGRFQVTHPGGSKLTMAAPSAFGFLGARPAGITVNGAQLATVPGTLGLIGGPVTVRDGALARAGTIDVTAVAGKAVVPVAPRRVSTLPGKQFGGVILTSGAQLEVGGAGAGKPRLLSITARQLRLFDGAKILSGVRRGHAAPIFVDAHAILINGQADPNSPTEIGSQTTGPATAGRVRVTADTLRILGNGEIASTPLATGDAGSVEVDAAGRLTIDGAGANPLMVTGIDVSAGGGSNGNAGNIRVTAGRLRLAEGGTIASNTGGEGHGGRVSVGVAGRLTIAGAVGATTLTGIVARALKESTGNAGDVRVAAGSLRLAEFGAIESDTQGRGHGGDVSVKVSGEGARALTVRSNGVIAATTEGPGHGGRVAVHVNGGLKIDGAGGVLFPPSSIAAAALPGSKGNAGSVRVSTGSLSISVDGQISAATFGTGQAGNVVVAVTGRLTIDGLGANASQGGAFFVTGIDASSGAPGNGTGAGNAGRARVSAGSLAISNSGEISAATFGAGHGGAIAVRITGQLTIDGAHASPLIPTGIFSQAARGRGNGGDLSVFSGSLRVTRDGEIASGTFGSGNGGSVFVTAAGQVSIDRGGEITAVSGGGSGHGGNVTITSANLTIESGGEIFTKTFGPGSGGNIVLSSADGILIDANGKGGSTGILATATSRSTGTGGNATIDSGVLAILDGGVISTERFGSGHTGSISVGAEGKLSIDGGPTTGVTGISARSKPRSIRNAGNVMVDATALSIRFGSISASTSGAGMGGSVTVTVAGPAELTDAAQITAGTAGPGTGGTVAVSVEGALTLAGSDTGITASAMGPRSGAGGAVTVAAGSLTVDAGAEIASSTGGLGSGGDVSVVAGSDIRLSGSGPQITALSRGSGDAGQIAVVSPNLLLNDGAAISTQAKTANGGDLTLTVADLLYLRGSGITTSVHGAAGNGGNIVINSGLTILDHGTVQARAKGGNGGNITIDKYAGEYVQSTDSVVSASSQKGISGVVEINGITPLNGALVALSSELRSAVALTDSSCAARAARPQSSLIAAGRGGLPQDPDATLSALYIAGRDVRLGPPVGRRRADAAVDMSATLPLTGRCG
jgi:filamentous hemagglutinin family protein